MNEQIEPKLKAVLNQAIEACTEDVEEEGGVILKNQKTGELKYKKLHNANSGTSIAPVLWTADRDEYADSIIPLFKEGWIHYASFHTHPRFLPLPSNIDLTVLFPGFPVNYIYSPATQEITQWDFEGGQTFTHKATFMHSTVHRTVSKVFSA